MPNPQYVPNVVAVQPHIVTVNIGGNDFLATDGDHENNLQVFIYTQASIQEALSSMMIDLTEAADDCDTSDNHARLTPLWTQVAMGGEEDDGHPRIEAADLSCYPRRSRPTAPS